VYVPEKGRERRRGRGDVVRQQKNHWPVATETALHQEGAFPETPFSESEADLTKDN